MRVEGLVSVVIPTYNQVNFIDETIKSVIEQSYKELEIIIADDCSTDGTVDILQKHAANDPRIRLLLSDKNVGIPANFNKAFDAVTGEFIAFLGGDDLMFPRKIEKLKNVLVNNEEIGLVYSDMEVHNAVMNTTTLHSEKGIFNQPLDWALKIDWYLEKDTGILPSACLARSNYYLQAKYDDRFYLKHELWFTLTDYYLNPKMEWIYFDEVLGSYRLHQNNFSKSEVANNKIIVETLLVSELCLEKFPESRERVEEHLKYFTFQKLLFTPHIIDKYPRFRYIFQTFSFRQKLHLKLSRLAYKLNFFGVYKRIAKFISIV